MTLVRIVCTSQFYISGQSSANDSQIGARFCTPVVALPPNEVMSDHAPLKTPARSWHAKPDKSLAQMNFGGYAVYQDLVFLVRALERYLGKETFLIGPDLG